MTEAIPIPEVSFPLPGPRYAEAFPILTPTEIERVGRFGERRAFANAEALLQPASRRPECS